MATDSDRGGRLALPVVLVLVAGCALPLAVLFVFSFFQVDFVAILKVPTLKNYIKVASSPTYRSLIGQAIASGLTVAAISAVIGYPLAWVIAKRVHFMKSACLTLLLIPLYTGDLVRIFAWRVVLGAEGVINAFLMWAGLVREPIRALLFSPFATHVVLTYDYLPFMVLGLWLAFESLDDHLLEAARDLGASEATIFRRIVLPLTSPGLIAGGMMVFVLVVGDYLTPQLIGGSSGVTVISAINDLFGTAFDWPLGSAIASSLLLILGVLIAAAALVVGRSTWGRAVVGGE
ncbi:ABC transporter permease [Siculibacillus lacustris]|uniref:ABC transporter permease n=1 Tax=Siculibacillus lacustris TaxID=1549641 RepID=A0A4Q9VTM0_9HYPH|nr:ABC transporter permease [Siculibacillus lacustris]TBW38440.1 ABC transporter permease [Siculibacillus lacustris]